MEILCFLCWFPALKLKINQWFFLFFTGPDSADSASFLLLSLHCFLVISAWVRRVSVMNSHFELRGNWFCDDDSVLNPWESMSNQRNFVKFCWIWYFCVDSVEINGELRWLGFLPLMNLWSFLCWFCFDLTEKREKVLICFWWSGVWWMDPLKKLTLFPFYKLPCVHWNQ